MDRQVRFAATNIEHEIKTDECSSEEPSDNDEDSPGATKRQFNKFELLDLVEDDGQFDETNSDDETPSDTDKETKHNISATNKGITAQSSKRKPRKKRGKSKANKESKSSKDDVDEHAELADLAKIINQKSEPQPDDTDSLKYKLLKVDTRNLVPEIEIKRIFGKGVVKGDRVRPKHHAGLNVQRSRLVSSIETKISGHQFQGPKMELDDTINDMRIGYKLGGPKPKQASPAPFNSSEPIYFKFVHDKTYQETQKLFLTAVHGGHSEFIVQSIQDAPSHAESLIQLSDMFRESEDYKTASEFIERALVVFERGFHPRFNLSTATCRLSYKRPENRTFFITIFKHINACHRRGLRKTPFEYSKLLLSLEPDNDPLMAVQLLDFFAIRSEEYDFLIDFYAQWEQLQKLPNLSFALAMAHFLKSRNTKRSKVENDASLKLASESLQSALTLFPNFIIPLLDACSGEPDSELKKCGFFDYSVYGTKYKLVPETVDVLVALYVKRTYSLWKQKHVLAWLESNVAEMVSKLARSELVDEGKHIQHWSTFTKVAPKNLLRHIALCDLGMKVPPSASSSTYIDLDPYPPTDSVISYDASLASNRVAHSSGGGSIFDGFSGLFFRSILPSFSLGDQNPADLTASPTTSGSRVGNQRNRPAQRRAANTAVRPQTAGPAAREIDPGLDLDYESIEYSLLIDALRDLPPLGPNSTQETSRPAEAGGSASEAQQPESLPDNTDGGNEDTELRRRQTRPS